MQMNMLNANASNQKETHQYFAMLDSVKPLRKQLSNQLSFK